MKNDTQNSGKLNISGTNGAKIQINLRMCHLAGNAGQEANPDGDDQHSDMDLDLLVESESDSDGEAEGGAGDRDNQENQGGANNDNDALFSDDDSGGESTHPEDEESDAGAEVNLGAPG